MVVAPTLFYTALVSLSSPAFRKQKPGGRQSCFAALAVALHYLLSELQGINVNLVTINRVSSLHEACLGGHVACAKILLENGAHVSTSPALPSTAGFVCPGFSAKTPGQALPSRVLTHRAMGRVSPIRHPLFSLYKPCVNIQMGSLKNILFIS